MRERVACDGDKYYKPRYGGGYRKRSCNKVLCEVYADKVEKKKGENYQEIVLENPEQIIFKCISCRSKVVIKFKDKGVIENAEGLNGDS
jgi:hypothetical protein